ncbi:hypothetical protein GN244_ATG12748 [Phytophthora infestans]|uniref:Uncharacterized protein n=1 Tax=Phytophthora infestans TaxID=4787 RepID=A0A833T7X9_PHYIN|nr:hypothetical protein GN244_ATG12748 [Phytophthora infestans]
MEAFAKMDVMDYEFAKLQELLRKRGAISLLFIALERFIHRSNALEEGHEADKKQRGEHV